MRDNASPMGLTRRLRSTSWLHIGRLSCFQQLDRSPFLVCVIPALLVLHDTRPRLTQHQPGPAALVRAAIEYALIASLITLVCIAAFQAFGQANFENFQYIRDSVDDALAGSSGS